jgi:hypothetical protein
MCFVVGANEKRCKVLALIDDYEQLVFPEFGWLVAVDINPNSVVRLCGGLPVPFLITLKDGNNTTLIFP